MLNSNEKTKPAYHIRVLRGKAQGVDESYYGFSVVKKIDSDCLGWSKKIPFPFYYIPGLSLLSHTLKFVFGCIACVSREGKALHKRFSESRAVKILADVRVIYTGVVLEGLRAIDYKSQAQCEMREIHNIMYEVGCPDGWKQSTLFHNNNISLMCIVRDPSTLEQRRNDLCDAKIFINRTKARLQITLDSTIEKGWDTVKNCTDSIPYNPSIQFDKRYESCIVKTQNTNFSTPHYDGKAVTMNAVIPIQLSEDLNMPWWHRFTNMFGYNTKYKEIAEQHKECLYYITPIPANWSSQLAKEQIFSSTAIVFYSASNRNQEDYKAILRDICDGKKYQIAWQSVEDGGSDQNYANYYYDSTLYKLNCTSGEITPKANIEHVSEYGKDEL